MDKIVLFIPMYNCEKQIVRVLGQLSGAVCEYISHAIVVNNRSTDNGEQAVIRWLQENRPALPVTLLRNDENYGLGGSHKVAFDYAINNGYDYIIVLHGDDQGDISNIVPYLGNREYAKYDSFLGARFMKGSSLEGYSKFRTFGNRVYDLLFSAGAGRMIYDLGSGLNMYKVSALESRYYLRFKDNLVFNCYMLLAAGPLGQSLRFFPISWREEDQVSNVKMFSQATKTLRMLMGFAFNKRTFLSGEYRDKIIPDYTAQTVFEWEA